MGSRSCSHAIILHSSESEQIEVDVAALEMGRSQPLSTLYDLIVVRILEASEATAVSFRAKALRAINTIVAQDAGLFAKVRT